MSRIAELGSYGMQRSVHAILPTGAGSRAAVVLEEADGRLARVTAGATGWRKHAERRHSRRPK